MPSADLTYVDADGHIVEPPDQLPDFAPEAYRDRVWHVETDDGGEDWVVVGERRVAANVMAFAAAGGLPPDEREAAHRGEVRYAEMRSGGWHADARLRDMDAEGIQQSVLYPTMLLSFQSQHPLDVVEAQCQAYNNWLSAHVADSGGRLHGAAIVPHRDAERAAAEIRRVADLPGIVAVHLRPNPALDWKPVSDEAYDPIWAAASDAGLPIGFHPLMSADLPGAALGLRINQLGTSEIPVQEDDDMNVDNVFFSQMIANPVDMMTTITFCLAGGVCRRFPGPAPAVPGSERRLDRPLAGAARPPLRDLRLGCAAARPAALGVLPRAVLDQLRLRRVHPGLHRRVRARRCRPHRLGQRLPPPRRQDARCDRGPAGRGRTARRPRPGCNQRGQCLRPLRDLMR